MGRIEELAPGLVDQIAAGEVVERPASVVKELLENALDAGASRVSLEVEGGGAKRIRVTDDGQGVHPDDMALAVTSHATSKIRTADDLFAIGTLGFRGEALASIAAVSHLRLASRRPDAEGGAEVEVDGGRAGAVRPAGLPPGTTVEVADLFYNVPARRSFLKKERSELRAVLAEVRRQALSRPDVSFHASSDGKKALEAAAEDEPRERIAQLLGRDLAEDLLALPLVRSEAGALRGYVTPTDRSRGDSQQQYFFLNGRAIRDVTLLSAVKTAYANLLPPRRHPSALIWLDVTADSVDVNVHPQKAEVRFQRDRDVFQLVLRAIRQALQDQGLAAEYRLSRRRAPEEAAAPPPPPGSPAAGEPPSPADAGPAGEPPTGEASSPAAAPAAGATATLPREPTTAPLAGVAAEVGRALQVHRRYVVEETPQGLRLVDPHALHERILYEEIRDRLEREPLESQRFLFPQILEGSAVELTAAEERGAELERLGFEVAPFGQSALAVHAAPRLLRAERVAETVRALLGEEKPALDPEEEASGLLHDLAASLACRSAVRFGEALPEGQIRDLLAQRTTVRRGHCCPHGRPTALALTLDEIDRRFRRQGD